MNRSEKDQSFPRIKIRIESLSDLVFGLALSIGSLELLAKTPQHPDDLAVSLSLFAFSFFIVISIWIGYTRIMTITPQETSGTVSLNLLLLFCVVLEPYLFFLLQTMPSDISLPEWTSFAYALDVGGMFLILGAMIRLALSRKTSKEIQELHPLLLQRFRLAMIFYTIIGGSYALSALPFFWVETPVGMLRFTFWYSSFAFVFLGVVFRRLEKHSALRPPGKQP